MKRYELVHRDDTLRLGVADGRVMVATWRGTPDVAQLGAIETQNRVLARKYDGAYAVVHIVLDGSIPSFDAEFAAQSGKIAKEFSEVPTLYVIMLPGFGGTAVRSFLSTVMLIARPAAVKVVENIDSGAAWLAEIVGAWDSRWTAPEASRFLHAIVAERESDRPSIRP